MIPERLLQFAVVGLEATPRYLTPVDHAWLRVLIEEFERFDGSKVDRLRERLREPLPCYAPEGKLRLAIHVLSRLCGPHRRVSPVSPRRARSVLFSEAQRARDRSGDGHGTGDPDRSAVVFAAAVALGVSPEALLESLFADLPGERLVRVPSPLPEPQDLALRANLALAQGFLQRAVRVTLRVRGNARAVVRQVQLRRLLCTVHPRTSAGRAAIAISGPYALFKRTLLYGRALASLVPVLRACDHFELVAQAVLRGRELRVRVASGDPIFPQTDLPRRYDSALEARFSLDLRRLAPELDLVREPEPLRAGNQLVFPDFAIHHRSDPTRCVLVEIVGFWTPDYLERKLRGLRAARTPVLLCVDEALGCSGEALAAFRQVVPYRRRIDARAVLAHVESLLRSRPQGG